jgi:hypothetical protein
MIFAKEEPLDDTGAPSAGASYITITAFERSPDGGKGLARDALKPWHAERLPLVEDRVRGRLNQLSVRLGDADWLDGAFSAGTF